MELYTWICAEYNFFAHGSKKTTPDVPFYYQFILRPLLIWESHFFHKWSCRQEPALFGVEFKLFAKDSNFLLQSFPSFIIVFPDHPFFEKVNFVTRQEPPLSGAEFKLHKTLKYSSEHFLLSSPCSQSTPSMRKSNVCISGVACMKRTMKWCCRHGTPLLWTIKTWCSKLFPLNLNLGDRFRNYSGWTNGRMNIPSDRGGCPT